MAGAQATKWRALSPLQHGRGSKPTMHALECPFVEVGTRAVPRICPYPPAPVPIQMNFDPRGGNKPDPAPCVLLPEVNGRSYGAQARTSRT